jgi:hypothetical protein
MKKGEEKGVEADGPGAGPAVIDPPATHAVAAVSATEQAVLTHFLETYSTTPDWVDPARLDRGGDLFLRYLPASTAALFFLSLVGGFSAPLITKVLSCTGYMTSSGSATMKRLLETFQMVAECTLHGSEGLAPGGVGWKAVLRVRFLHAKVRARVLGWGEKWDVETYGVPINQVSHSIAPLSPLPRLWLA